jgi:hypothetical protein
MIILDEPAGQVACGWVILPNDKKKSKNFFFLQHGYLFYNHYAWIDSLDTHMQEKKSFDFRFVICQGGVCMTSSRT